MLTAGVDGPGGGGLVAHPIVRQPGVDTARTGGVRLESSNMQLQRDRKERREVGHHITERERVRVTVRRNRNIQMTKKTFLTFVVEHLAGVEGEVGGAELSLAAAVDVPRLIPLVGLTLEAGSVDEEGVCLDTTNTLVNINTGHGKYRIVLSSVMAPRPQTGG